ncbi:hypothetical protein [Undibacterium terreum]|uniref:Uncharacterized protein n=1 Tax=Undibacterium terreum TaxID=1224302 RepID=A0A916XQ36_9BURK|nr:hypothetical protein [Undibacterium terreum]GGC94087.1 hypothetical protein GCM10011396_46770 [Undibacterium terreum]
MNHNISSASAIAFPVPPDEFSAELQSCKHEKFLFEDTPAAARSKTAEIAPLPHISYRSKPRVEQNDFIMRITVDAAAVTELRHVIVGTCGELVNYMRVKPVDHATKMKVWLCLSKSSVDTIIRNVMRALPQAEFGKITPLLPV